MFRDHALVYLMRACDDLAPRCLPKHFGQAHHGNRARSNDVSQNLSWTHRCQLVDVANDEEGAIIGDGLQQSLHQHNVDH
jgi:hypothetical protein